MKKFIIPDWAKESLAEGNRYTFAELFAQKFPKEFKKNKFEVGNYNAWVDWNEEDKIYTVWTMADGGKAYFDTKLNCTGFKDY
jgi:hypothetical protein